MGIRKDNLNLNIFGKKAITKYAKTSEKFKVVIDRKEGNYFVGRTEFDSPDVDNEVLIDASKCYMKTGEFTTVKITDAADFDLYGEVIN
jgi:ribosomal protein S12 methylthiotransferase